MCQANVFCFSVFSGESDVSQAFRLTSSLRGVHSFETKAVKYWGNNCNAWELLDNGEKASRYVPKVLLKSIRCMSHRAISKRAYHDWDLKHQAWVSRFEPKVHVHPCFCGARRTNWSAASRVIWCVQVTSPKKIRECQVCRVHARFQLRGNFAAYKESSFNSEQDSHK